jgi:outer membrane protein insertion porin family
MRSLVVIAMVLAIPSLARADDPPLAETTDGSDATVAEVATPKPPTGRFQIGAGLSSDEGFIATATLSQDDLFHTGQHLALSAELSQLRQQLRGRYDVPNAFGSGRDLTTEVWTTRRQLPGFEGERIGGSLTASQRFGASTRGYLRYRAEEVTTTLDHRSIVPRVIDQRGETYNLAGLGAGLAYDTLDQRQLPTRGTRVAIDLASSDHRLGADVDLVRADIALDHARPLGPFRFRVAGRAGYVRGAGGAAVPLSERYQPGGYADLPGYPIGSIGTDLSGLARGFDGEVVARAELELPLIPRYGISIAAFAAASAGYNGDPARGPIGTEVNRSVGLSLVWRSPIGPLRFDWAIPLDRAHDREPRVSFGVGSTW